jgi:CheY-like chemotaxis protein/signal transduction histidine kinase
MKLADIRISGKLYGLILVALIGMLSLAGLSQYQMGKVYDAANLGTDNVVPSILFQYDAMNSFQNMRVAGALHMSATSDAKMTELGKLVQTRGEEVEVAFKNYEPLFVSDEDRRLLEKERDLFREYLAGLELALQLSHEHKSANARELFAKNEPLGIRFERAMAEHLLFNKKLSDSGSAEGLEIKESAMKMSLLVTTLALVLVSLVAWLIATKGLASPIAAVVGDLMQLASGKPDVTITGLERRDEVGDIARAAQVFKEFAQKLNLQGWIKAQVAELSAEMQTAESPADFAQTVIGKIAPLLEGGAAVFYILQAEKQRYTLMGGWGYRELEQLPAAYRVGEGLIGQCARDKKPILLNEVPGDALRISSGLVDAVPRVILVVPVISKDVVIGVIEIASFTGFTEAQQALVNELLPVVALNLEIVERNMKTLALLRETQEQAQELQASEEEMRRQSEELATTNEELRASEEELRAQSDMQKVINEELTVKGAALQEAQEISERRAAELETASRYKSDFLANMSHELRTPLNSLLILAKSLSENEERNLTDEQIESAQIIHDGGHHLLRLINDILDLSKVEAGKMTVAEDDVEVAAFVTGITRYFSALAKSQSLQLRVDVSPDVPHFVRGDKGKIEQIITNLVGNAFKFTRQGGVTVRLSRLASNGSTMGDRLAIAVEDTGIGIPADKLEQIFGAFEQVDGSSSRQYGGTGLGLTISRRLANLLGGDITVSSVVGRGSIFTLTLPLYELSGVSPARLHDMPETVTSFADDRATLKAGDKVIMIVEDDDVFARIECDLARKRGFKYLRAADGKAALELAERYRPDGILLDIGLPDLDGWVVMDSLKKNPATRNIPVRIISGFDDSERGLAMGAVGHLQKPVDKTQLNEVFDRLSLLTGNNVRRVLIVDDDENSRKAVGMVVEGKQVELIEVSDGHAALGMLESGRFDCMILDLDLPDFSGFELLERARKQWGELPPVVVYTGRNLSYEENLALREYTDSIVVKGGRSQERLVDEVSLFLHGVQSGLPAARQPVAASMPGKVKALEGKTVLLVDDDMRNAFALSKVLRGKGVSVLLAQDGYKALAQLEAHAGVNVVLMDIMMPGMDGYETIRQIRAQSRLSRLPIIALTAKAMPGDREKCIGVGANEYFSKPVDVDRLVEAMSALVQQG